MQRSTTRQGFTLVELLVVIAIISILVSLTMAAVQKVRQRGQDAQCRTEITQLETAISTFKTKFGVYPPCCGTVSSSNPHGMFKLSTTYTSSDLELIYLKQMFPRINASDTGLRALTAGQATPYSTTATTLTTYLDPNQCLVFFLSGGVFTGYTGFATNPQMPFQAPGVTTGATVTLASRLNNGPMFDFPPSRMVVRSNFTASYFTPGNGLRFTGDSAPNTQTSEQPWYTDPWGAPYLYLNSTQGNDYPFAGTTTPIGPTTPLTIGPWGGTYSPNSAGVSPFYTGSGASLQFKKATSTQIISGGRDQKFGPGGLYNPGAGLYALNQQGGDDYSNFQQTPLGVTD